VTVQIDRELVKINTRQPTGEYYVWQRQKPSHAERLESVPIGIRINPDDLRIAADFLEENGFFPAAIFLRVLAYPLRKSRRQRENAGRKFLWFNVNSL
jgi:hypothetical protein